MGGVGKTEIATEYIHLHRHKYEIIWWIRAEHTDRVRDALVKLGQRLEVRPAGTEGGRDRTIAAVLETLASGSRPNWLLVYDNAAQPLELQRYLPACPPGGHIIITSRLQNWPGYIEKDNVGVSPFTKDEAISFLRRRVPALEREPEAAPDEDERRISEAGRLAEALGHLPIAIEHAAAYLTETGHSVDGYLSRFEENAHRLLNEQLGEFPASVSATWTMSTELLTPDAEHLFNLCAFFSPEPIAVELCLNHARAVSDRPGCASFSPPRPGSGPRPPRCTGCRWSSWTGPGTRFRCTGWSRPSPEVSSGRTGRTRSWPTGTLSTSCWPSPIRAIRTAAASTRSTTCRCSTWSPSATSSTRPTRALRRLIIDQVRRLHLRGGHVEAMRFGQDILRVWRERLGPDDLHVLALAVEVAIAMQLDGHAADARRLILETRAVLDELTTVGARLLTISVRSPCCATMPTAPTCAPGASSTRRSNSTAACCRSSRRSSARNTNAR